MKEHRIREYGLLKYNKNEKAINREIFDGKRELLGGAMNKNLIKRLTKCYVCSVAVLYGAEKLTLKRIDKKRIEPVNDWRQSKIGQQIVVSRLDYDDTNKIHVILTRTVICCLVKILNWEDYFYS